MEKSILIPLLVIIAIFWLASLNKAYQLRKDDTIKEVKDEISRINNN